MTMYGRLILGTILCIVQAIPIHASCLDEGSCIKLPQVCQPVAAIPLFGHVTVPFYLAARTSNARQGGVVTFSDLFNGESITMPSWLWNDVKDLNEQLKLRLSAGDYLTILKGENRLFAQYKTKEEYLRAVSENRNPMIDKIDTIQELRKKLGEILADPTSDKVFPRPRFVTMGKRGVMFREYIRYSKDEISLGDESYILSRERGLQSGYSSLWTFWDSRTGFPDIKFACQSSTLASSARGKLVGGSPIYYLMETYDECSSCDWCCSICAVESYLVDPRNKTFQALVPPGMSPFVDYEEYPDSGLLYRRGHPLPPTHEMYSASHAPWYAEGDAGKEFLHIRRIREELDFAWGKERIPLADNILFLDSLSQYGQANKEQGDNAKSVQDKIVRLMQPAPRDIHNSEPECIETGNIRNGYTLFLRYTHSGSEGGFAMFGMLTPNDEVLCFPIDAKGTMYGAEWYLLPQTGRLCPYSRCVDIAEKSQGRLKNVLEAYHMSDFAPPSAVTLLSNFLDDEDYLELVVGLESYGDVVVDIVRLSLKDYTYSVERRWRFPRSALNPKWISNQRIFMKPEDDFQYKIIQAEEDGNGRVLGDLYVEDSNSYAIVLPNGHYAGSPGCERFLQYGDGRRVVGMRALAPWRNRPAEVLEAIGGNVDDIVALRETTKRWLRKQGFDPENMPPEPQLDAFPVAEVEMPKLFNTSGTACFSVALKATAHDIKKMEVRADGVLIPQKFDADINVTANEERTVTVEVPLATGQNWIEVTPVDSKGISGDTTRFRVIYRGQYPSDLFIVALGVSDYENPDMKLRYAAKDARDIAAAFEKYGTGRKHVLVLTDRDVKDKSVMEKVKIFLSAASLEDRIVFYVAGHGILDDKLNYYYVPASFDPEHIAETSISMDELTGCLQDTKARKKLLLLDTCYSGMLGEEGEEKLALSGVQLPHGVRAIQIRGMKVKKAMGALSVNQRKRYVEDMFSRGNTQRGINIIAGTSGAEYALESGEWRNGVFTASVISAMKGEGAAQDVDGDGFFSVEELQQKVASTVQQQTGGQQRPSIVSAEGAENMILVEGVGYYKIKQLITRKNWSQLADVIRKSPRNYNDRQSEELVSDAIESNAPVAVIRQMIEHGASPQRMYGAALDKFLESKNPEYLSHRLEIAKLFAQSGEIKRGYKWTKQLNEIVYRLRNSGDEELAVVLLEKGVTNFYDPYVGENSLGLFEVFAKHGISPNYTKTMSLKAGNSKDIFRNILLANQEYRRHIKALESIMQSSTMLQQDIVPLRGTPLHELALLYCDVSTPSQKNEVLGKMQILLAHGANPNCLQGHRIEGDGTDDAFTTGVTPLYILCRNGKISFRDALPAIKLLIQHGANIRLPDCNGKEPLDRRDPNYKVLEQLEAAAKSGASMDNIQAVSTAVPNPPAPSYPVRGGDRRDLQPMIDRMAALRCREASSALYRKRLLALLPLIRDGADVNLTLPETKGNTALHYSCAIGNLGITEWLVNHGADVNAVTDKGATPLDCVGSDNGAQIRALLVSRGAERGARVDGGGRSVPVTYPVSGGDRSDLQPMINRMAALRCRDVTSALYQKRLLALLPLVRDGSDVNLTLPETKGNTALHYSCAIGNLGITEWLVNHGADVNAVTDKGATPLDCVGSDNGKRIRALLKSRGAKHASEL